MGLKGERLTLNFSFVDGAMSGQLHACGVATSKLRKYFEPPFLGDWPIPPETGVEV